MRCVFPPISIGLSLSIVLVSACGGGDDRGSSDAAAPDTGAADATAPVPSSIGPDDRPARVIVPSAHDGVTALPLVVLLHGYGASASIQDAYWGLSRHARANGYYLLLPDGTVDGEGNRFWNATPACCDWGGTGVDDEGYLSALVEEMKSLFPIDSGRVYFTGHSNGGFMSYRMACAMADQVTAIGSLAGSTFATEAECGASQPVSVLQVHGNLDGTVSYAGNGFHPSAEDAVLRWAERAGCDTATPTTLEPLDIETDLAGAETSAVRYETGCAEGIDAELWTIQGGGHIPSLNAEWAPRLIEWLFRHSR